MAEKQILLLRSGTSGLKPTSSALDAGEIGINYNDEIIYVKKNSGLAEFSSDKKFIKEIKTNLSLSDLKLPTGGSDGQILKKSGNSLIWANEKSGDTPSVSTSVSVSQTITRGNEIAKITVDGVQTPIYTPNYLTKGDADGTYIQIPSGGSDGQVLKKSGSSVVWANDETGSGETPPPSPSTSATKIINGTGTISRTVEGFANTYAIDINGNYLLTFIQENTPSQPKVTISEGDGITLEVTENTNNTDYKISLDSNQVIPTDGVEGQVLTKTSNGIVWGTASDESDNEMVWEQKCTEGTEIATLKIGNNEEIHVYTPETNSLPPFNNSAGKVLKVDENGESVIWADDEKGDASDALTEDEADALYVNKNGDEMTGDLRVGSNRIVLETNGQISTQTNNCSFYVQDDKVYMHSNGGGSFQLLHDKITCDGTTITAKEFYAESDKRLKSNISSIKNKDKVGKVEFKQFNYKSDINKTEKYGVIAQDVEKAGLKNLITTNTDGFKSVDYISLLCLKIAQLEDKIKDLENKLK